MQREQIERAALGAGRTEHRARLQVDKGREEAGAGVATGCTAISSCV
jgi:hypothetical protein